MGGRGVLLEEGEGRGRREGKREGRGEGFAVYKV